MVYLLNKNSYDNVIFDYENFSLLKTTNITSYSLQPVTEEILEAAKRCYIERYLEPFIKNKYCSNLVLKGWFPVKIGETLYVSKNSAVSLKEVCFKCKIKKYEECSVCKGRGVSNKSCLSLPRISLKKDMKCKVLYTDQIFSKIGYRSYQSYSTSFAWVEIDEIGSIQPLRVNLTSLKRILSEEEINNKILELGHVENIMRYPVNGILEKQSFK